jgi:hypothetical protein
LPPILIRWFPSLVGLAVFAAMAILFRVDPARYLAILHVVGIHPWHYPFIDSGFMYAMKRCWLAGVDVYRSVPCDVVPGNKMAYSPLWQRLPFLPTQDSARVPVGVASDLLLLLSVGLLPAMRTGREAAILALAMPSTMVCFALERNNIDVWIYLLIVAGGLVLTRTPRLRGAAYAIFAAAGLLKYYPFALFGLAFREALWRCLAILAAIVIAILLFWLTFHAELREEFANIPAGSPFTDMVGIANFPIAIGDFARYSARINPLWATLLQGGCRLFLTILVFAAAIRLARRPGFEETLAGLAAHDRLWLVLGCLVMGGCYLLGQNVGYRGIYLLIVLAGLLALCRAVPERRLLEELTAVTMTILPILWMEGLRHGVDLALASAGADGDTRHAVKGIAWAVREALWLNLERLMLAIVIVDLWRSRALADLLKTAVLRRS